jgi:kinetochore protein NDC80
VGPSNGGAAPGTAKARPPRGRASMIPRVGRENGVPPTPPSASAKKATPGSRSRRSSGINGDRRQSVVPPSAPAKTDPRPITDRAFQQECIKQLLDFLMTKGYEHPISHRSLARPSGKDFTNIVTFMLRLVDPNFQDGSMKIEDEVAMNFKALGYPFPVSKTALVAAGSPHTWPSLLAALAWLMERIQSIENTVVDANDDPGHFDSLEELENKTDKAFFKYLSKAYTAFLRGDEQLTEQLENALADRFERDDTIIEQEIEQMTDKNAVIVEQINNLTFGGKEYVFKSAVVDATALVFLTLSFPRQVLNTICRKRMATPPI